jgi:hypothetical protein
MQACSDFRVEVLDMDTRRVVRVFPDHAARITDMVGRGSILIADIFLIYCHTNLNI